jgi:hypothetical protein
MPQVIPPADGACRPSGFWLAAAMAAVAGLACTRTTPARPLFPVQGQVLLDGKPLAGATVRFVPEKFLGDGFKPAEGVCDERGLAELRTEGGRLPGVACGFYRVEVCKPGGGKESLPARYNAASTLGHEVAPDTERGNITFRLSTS